MKKLSTFFAAATLAMAGGSLIHTDVAYAQASAVGQLRGIVKDKGTNEAAVGATVVASAPEAFAAHVRAEVARWRALTASAGIQPE